MYCDWSRRDSLLLDQETFTNDLLQNLDVMASYQDIYKQPRFFMPPYEWYNQRISDWAKDLGIQIINYTPGTLSNADYTTPAMTNYRSSEAIWNSIVTREATASSGLNGYILLLHIGTDPARTDKFYKRLPALLQYLKGKRYRFVKIDQLLKN